jgi:hypothetical protein
MILNTYLKGDTIILAAFGGGSRGFLFKMGVRQNNCKLKQINMDLIQNLIKFVANSGVAELN